MGKSYVICLKFSNERIPLLALCIVILQAYFSDSTTSVIHKNTAKGTSLQEYEIRIFDM
jgi:hypothetical protein